MLLRLWPTPLALLLLGAHFLRADNLPVAVFLAVLPLLLIWRRIWAPRIIQTVLSLGLALWAHTSWTLVQIRQHYGLPYDKLILIMGGVMGFTLLAILLLQSNRVQQLYRQ